MKKQNHQPHSCCSKEVVEQAKYEADCCENREATTACGLIYAGVAFSDANLQDEKQSIAYFEKGIKMGDEAALMHLIHAFLTGKVAGEPACIQPSYDAWLNLCEKLAKAGNQAVAYSAANWFAALEKPGPEVSPQFLQHFKPDPEKAIAFFELATKGDDEAYAEAARHHLTLAFKEGLGNIKPDPTRLETLFK